MCPGRTRPEHARNPRTAFEAVLAAGAPLVEHAAVVLDAALMGGRSVAAVCALICPVLLLAARILPPPVSRQRSGAWPLWSSCVGRGCEVRRRGICGAQPTCSFSLTGATAPPWC